MGAPRYGRPFPKQRARIYRRDGWRCRYCGVQWPLSVDHVRPLALGGGWSDDNLVTLCVPCNTAKGLRDDTLVLRVLAVLFPDGVPASRREAEGSGRHPLWITLRGLHMVGSVELERRFGYHPATEENGNGPRHEAARASCLALAQLIDALPDSREKSLALTSLEETMLWWNAAIARPAPLAVPPVSRSAHVRLRG